MTRSLEILIGNSTYAFGMIVVIYLLGIATGSWVMALCVNRLKSPATWLAGFQMRMGLWIFVAIALFTTIGDRISVSDQGNAGYIEMKTLLWHYLQAVSLLFPLLFSPGAFSHWRPGSSTLSPGMRRVR